MYEQSDLLRVDREGSLRILTFNNPTMRNAMLDELHEAITDVWVDLSRDTEARAVIITGAGKSFSAGGHFPMFVKNSEDLEYRRTGFRTTKILTDHILGCHLPVIAAVNGAAVGLGASIAMSCDIVLMADDAFLSDTHVPVGLVAGDGGVVTWPFMMSMLKVKEYLFTGERIPAEKAVELGMANRVVAAESLMSEARAFATRLAELPAQALQDTKRALNIYLQQAALSVLPFALAAESESFTGPEVLQTVEDWKSKKAQDEQ